ncbi:MAG: hypothetical protein D6705_08900 [Deltaproteobacteria bacterium]|nr:MAG: hypothetical protein D6705_08900 [Deltaproteobacteria bacterium]
MTTSWMLSGLLLQAPVDDLAAGAPPAPRVEASGVEDARPDAGGSAPRASGRRRGGARREKDGRGLIIAGAVIAGTMDMALHAWEVYWAVRLGGGVGCRDAALGKRLDPASADASHAPVT